MEKLKLRTKLGQKLGKIKKLVLGSLAFAAMAMLIASPSSGPRVAKSANSQSGTPRAATTTGTGTPRFNFLTNDREMLQAANFTRGDANWVDPVTANVGDRVAFLLYFHNGIVNSVAHNTTVRVDLQPTQGTTLKAFSHLWFDESPRDAQGIAQDVQETVIDGQVIGQPGATVNLPSNGRFEYVKGSTKLYTFDTGQQVVTPMADGITVNGINIGDMRGCWQFSGYVSFLVDIKGQAQLVMDKQAGVPGSGLWQKEVTDRRPGDEISYLVTIRNDGNINASNILLTDLLPPFMTYIAGTTKIRNAANPNDSPMPDTLFTEGLSIPEMAPGGAGLTYITYKLRVVNALPPGWHNLTNEAKVYLAGVFQDKDIAIVKVFSAQPGLTVDKKVLGPNGPVEQLEVNLLGNVTYQIKITNTGNTAIDNVSIRDILPEFVTFLPGTVKLDGKSSAEVGFNLDQIISATGVNIGRISEGSSAVITLSGNIEGCPPAGGEILNTAIVNGGGIQQTDTALVIVKVTTPSQPAPNTN